MVRTQERRTHARSAESVQHLSQEAATQLIDEQSRKFLKMSGEDFVRRYRAGEIEQPHRLAVARVAVLLPLAEK
ncbi:MAG TPA: hypothetical protein VFQ80_03570 [Thermomicrobiales bacterium]|nr:hypothetical protein [Thermomicrobiales bacterium]